MVRSLSELVRIAQQFGPAAMAVVAAEDRDVLESVRTASSMGLVQPILLGDADKIASVAASIDYQIQPEMVIATHSEEEAIARAIHMARSGEIELLMKGKVTTANLVRAVLDKTNGIRSSGLLSQVIVFQVAGIERLMLMSDAAINIAPTLSQKVDICRNAIRVAHALGIEKPNLALLTALEFVNPDMPATVDAAALTMMNRRAQISGAYLEGPVALDVPLSAFAAERKAISGPLVERTDIFIPPDIEATNILYRSIVYLAHGESAGIVVGARIPLVLLSRAETPETKVRSVALARLVQTFETESTRASKPLSVATVTNPV